MAKMTLIGMYNYFQYMHDDLFKHLSLPEGIDRETVINTILLRSGEFECVYSDPNFVQWSIMSWSNRWSRTIFKWVNALSLEYDPLSNYDRNETWTDSGTGSSTGSDNTTVTGQKSAYNSSSFENESKTMSNGGSTSNTQNSNTHTGHVSGNIGVTTSQQMLQSELDIAFFNLYDHIADLFVRDFCIAIY